MPALRPFALLVLGCAMALSGCGAMQSMRTSAAATFAGLRPASSNYSDPTEEASDPWIQQVGVEARGNRPKEKSEEPEWFRNLMTSQKARDIEDNLGFH